ncbi:MAG: 4-(cytidine 5'-diphospho)-2-C-methyl-D-erythritol kinase [Acetobacteraceae bacterium]
MLGRRRDGYHLLDSLAVFATAADTLSAARAPSLSLAVTGPFAPALGAGEDNLVLRAARALAAAAGVPARARLALDKRLPVAAGLGGGSADAAAALRALNILWGTGLGEADLARIGSALGADVPVCLAARPARMGGIGERLAPPPRLPPFGLLLANPGVPVATPAVFAARSGPFQAAAVLPDGWSDAAAMARDLARLGNGLEAAARTVAPEIGPLLDTLRALPGALLARLSGSGPTGFAIFATADEAERAAGEVTARHPEWWVHAGGAGGDQPAVPETRKPSAGSGRHGFGRSARRIGVTE